MRKTTVEEHKELRSIQKKWKELFEKDLMLGFPTGPRQLPILRRCIEKKDSSEFYEWLSAETQKMREKRCLW